MAGNKADEKAKTEAPKTAAKAARAGEIVRSEKCERIGVCHDFPAFPFDQEGPGTPHGVIVIDHADQRLEIVQFCLFIGRRRYLGTVSHFLLISWARFRAGTLSILCEIF